MRGGKSSLLAPRRAWWWTAVLFVLGSTCFLVAPIPAFLELVGPQADGVVFFVGSLLFTAAAALQMRETVRAGGSVWQLGSRTWWSSAVQLAGTVFFNVTTFRGMSHAIESPSYDRLVWRPDAFGSVCFLISGVLAYVEIAGGVAHRPPPGVEGRIAAVNLFGCVAFGVSAFAGYVLPITEEAVDTRIANITTSVGALGFLVGALLLFCLPHPGEPATAPGQ